MIIKRIFDILFSLLALFFLWPLISLLILTASFDTNSFGIFLQKRVGQFGELFTIFKIKTVHPKTRIISPYGLFLRKTKLDELPQLINILIGDMSFVGPRPDISGYYDLLKSEERLILKLKPGLTSEASMKYKDEDDLLNKMDNPLKYNDEILFPDKVKINLDYYYNRTFLLDLKIIWKTVFL
ncbi:sugar transferase [Halpernia frigidisoli]|uniref:Sugar transferase involved in LPS biosynthesis (Colanic, teichoic acid) n=1 Tax=Halpernia frigidisoli TaxID=1125876 RepID=A0A1I3FCA5_9FLAO|nr:sugar transferase [Halpernia frigidisoli]SFI08845.1 Sugar transferase involved in LPS biosynthesis (colanic, teichoic acid) [Halpernia frigidisoli]